ncbi:gephyrin-like molybdotransferase Glp [Actinokineospora sp. UTMC 2448]|uniref:molybdopterin molybdotransferase MoeA n=1 Tax=Actinokineospora sp. UTMC 2448 TaxID=2268449 RepID=UPI002164C2CB|nr:gephyrin-like molybdotransferase Glp [Actinokineospora sp. UTMC 2448]UVS76765.1 Molybdopterin molybdenumtransferase [Actinokineospora sp. UTMC 2448]
MWSASDYRDRVAALVPPLPVVSAPLADCLGLVLAADVVAGVSLPPFDNSAMDGYAVRAADLGETTVLPVADDIPAGRTDVRPLEPGTAQRIMTGAPLPPGADAVVQVELTDGGMDTVTLRGRVEPGKHIRRAGEDVVAGTVVLRAGTVLGSARLGLAAAVGLGELPVRRRPRVVVLSTGTELTPPGEPLAPGRIYESNSVLLAAAVHEAGGEATVLRFVPDDVPAFLSAIEPYRDADLLITSGGVSAGAYEVVRDALSDRGVEFVRVAMQPGGPQGCGRIRFPADSTAFHHTGATEPTGPDRATAAGSAAVGPAAPDRGTAAGSAALSPTAAGPTAPNRGAEVRQALEGPAAAGSADSDHRAAGSAALNHAAAESAGPDRGAGGAAALGSAAAGSGAGDSGGGLAVVTLPGNPVSAALSFELFVRPALLRAAGHAVVDRPRARARTTEALRSPSDKVQYRRGRHDAGVVEVVPVGGPGSHLLASFAESNCLIELPVGVAEIAAGDEVDLVLLD